MNSRMVLVTVLAAAAALFGAFWCYAVMLEWSARDLLRAVQARRSPLSLTHFLYQRFVEHRAPPAPHPSPAGLSLPLLGRIIAAREVIARLQEELRRPQASRGWVILDCILGGLLVGLATVGVYVRSRSRWTSALPSGLSMPLQRSGAAEQDAQERLSLRTTGKLPVRADPFLFPLPRLAPTDREDILCGRWLSDDVIDLGQEILRRTFPEIRGLYACGAAFTLPPLLPGEDSLFLQVVNRSAPQVLASPADYSRFHGSHWLTITNFGAAAGELRVLDSAYRDMSQSTAELVQELLMLHDRPHGAVLPPVQRQDDGYSCGLFALAFAFSVALGEDPTNLVYDRSKMAAHLLECLEEGQVRRFPSRRK